MPELPDLTIYVESLARKLGRQCLAKVRLFSPFVLRTVDPTIDELLGRELRAVHRLGKRVVLELRDERFIVIHLMIAGRFQLRELAAKSPGRIGLAAFDFESASLLLTEASGKKRASIHLVRGREGLEVHRRNGIEPLEVDLHGFRAALSRERHTLKRALTDPDVVSGIGNAYSDEILHAAKLSPFALTTSLSEDEWQRLFAATRSTLELWIERLRTEADGEVPNKVTAFRPEMRVHGRYREACLLADRSLSRLMKEDWPRSLEALEELRPNLLRAASEKTRRRR
ncbi:MAG: formamidopyrimidine-DNA glycosylase [Deltaproteobacteria bacterium]|nr:formamidopyrimidine-DNA glycosylase [Deltaproteobacteria bacterium]